MHTTLEKLLTDATARDVARAGLQDAVQHGATVLGHGFNGMSPLASCAILGLVAAVGVLVAWYSVERRA
jgi:hypothetical protein